MLNNSYTDYIVDNQAVARDVTRQSTGERSMDDQGSYVIHMMKTLQKAGVSKNEISGKMKISSATFYRVQAGDTELLNYGNFRRLLYFYCWKVLCPDIEKDH